MYRNMITKVATNTLILLSFMPFTVSDDALLQQLTDSISKVVNYYASNYMYINLDGIYGLRVLEGQMKTILDRNDESTNRPAWLTEKITEIYQIASEVGQKSIIHVKNSDPNYYDQLGPLIGKQLMKSKPYRRVSFNVKWPKEILKVKGMSEEFSDHCMAELLGTGEHGIPCSPSEDCLKAMFEYGHQEYIILHQILYIMAAEQKNCNAELEQHLEANGLRGGIPNMIHIFCSNNLFEMVELINELPNKVIPEVYQDLFLEQQFVCPAQGYMEFLHEDWLKQIFSSQLYSGCFSGTDSNLKVEREMKRLNKEDDFSLRVHTYIQESEPDKQEDNQDNTAVKANDLRALEWNINYSYKKRQLLEERQLQDGCMSHHTAVGAAALSQYLKFLVDPGPVEYQREVNISGVNYLLYQTWQQMYKEKEQSQNLNSDSKDTDEGIDDPEEQDVKKVPRNYNDNKKDGVEKNDDFYPGYVYNLLELEKAAEHKAESLDQDAVTRAKNAPAAQRNGLPPFQSYAIIMVSVVVLLIYMYRFIRKRRIIIRYR